MAGRGDLEKKMLEMARALRQHTGRNLRFTSSDGLCTLWARDLKLTKVTLDPRLKGNPEGVRSSFIDAAKQMPPAMDEHLGPALQRMLEGIVRDPDPTKGPLGDILRGKPNKPSS